MTELPQIISDLSLILITGAIVGVLFRRLKQPLVLGYLVAGFLINSQTTLFPNVGDHTSIRIWADLGVIFLLFALGLEFSFKKLIRVGRVAFITASFEVTLIFCVGYLLGQAFGWSNMESLFLGAILCISSTTIIVKSIEELGFKNRNFTHLVFGVLVVEDLLAVLIIVLLSAATVTRTVSGEDLILTTLKLGFFLTLWFLLGIYLLPLIFKKIRKHLTDEITLIISIGLCLMMVIVASHAGFSAALGAFIMGSLIAETTEGKHIERIMVPVKNLFAAIFFVSVGMLMNVQVLYENWLYILFFAVVVILAKFLFVSMGSLVAGRSLKHAMQTGLSLTQIGEFSFIIAAIGSSTKVTNDLLYPMAIAISAITSFTTPYLMKYSDSIYLWFEKRMPAMLQDRIQSYQVALNRTSSRKFLVLFFHTYGLKIISNMVLIIAIAIASRNFLYPRLIQWNDNTDWVPFLSLLVALICTAPFMWALIFGSPNQKYLHEFNTFSQLRSLHFGIVLIRSFIGLLLTLFLFSQFFELYTSTGFLLLIVLITLPFVTTRWAAPIYKYFEKGFVNNLTDEKDAQIKNRLAPWDATLAEFVISADSTLAGKTLIDSALKEKFGVTVALIERGSKTILAPKRDDQFFPGDKVYLIGNDEQLALSRPFIETNAENHPPSDLTDYGLEMLEITDASPYAKKIIRTSGLRETINGLIIGIERQGQRILSPDSSLTLEVGDLIWVVGDKSKIRKIYKK